MTHAARPDLTGSWELLCWEIAYGDGRPSSFPYGADAQGLLVYSAGHMSASIARCDRPRLSSLSVRSAPEAQRLAAFESYFHYAGTYTVRAHAASPGGWQVVHRVTMALNPNFVGTEQLRDIEFDAQGRLTLSASDLVPGSNVARHHRLSWQRLQAPR
jgi:hypothetical protein